MKRLLSLFLILSMLTVITVSCDKKDTDGPAPSTVTNKYDLPDNITPKDYDGYEFRILTVGSTGGSHWSAYEFYYDDSLMGDALNEAVNTRDTDAGAIFNINIKYIEKDKDSMTDYVRQSVLSGFDEFDLVTAPLESAGILACEGLFANLLDYDDILNLDAEYWDQNATECMTIDNKLYFTISDLNLIDKQATNVVFFTKDMINKYPNFTEGYANGLYSMVEKGEWTLEKMYNMAKAVSADNGDGVQGYDDTFGWGGEKEISQAAMMIGCGAIGVSRNSAGEPLYVLDQHVETFANCFDKIYDMINTPSYGMTSTKMSDWFADDDIWVNGFGSMMEKNNLLFHLTNMNRCRLFRELETDFGIIPPPKANEQQERYYTWSEANFSNSVAIPVNAKDKERTCYILEGLSCIANETTYYAYIEQSLKGKYLRDDDSEAMLELIFDSRVYDLGDIFSYGVTHFGVAAVAGSITNPDTVASFIKKAQSRNEKTLARVLEDYRSNDE